MYVYQAITVEILDVRSLYMHTGIGYLQGIRVKFVYEDHQVKVKVTGAKKSKIPFPQCNVK